MKIFCNAGKTSVTLSPASSRRASAQCCPVPLPRCRSFRPSNGCKRSSHWVFSTSSCRSGSFASGDSRMSRRFKAEGRCKDEPQSCAIDETCRPNPLHKILNLNEWDPSSSSNSMEEPQITTPPRLCALNFSIQARKSWSRGVLNTG